MRSAVMVDLDGTLCGTVHRQHFVEGKSQEEADWDAYSMACADDDPVPGVIALVRMLKDMGYYILIVSGRSNKALQLTETWLAQHHVPWDRIYLRQEGDYTSNAEMKASIVVQERKRNVNVVLAVDDYQRVAEGLKEVNVPTVLVADMTGDLQASLSGDREKAL